MQSISNFVKTINPLAAPSSTQTSSAATQTSSLDFSPDDLADAHAFELGDESEWDKIDPDDDRPLVYISPASNQPRQQIPSRQPLPPSSAADALPSSSSSSLVRNPNPPPLLIPSDDNARSSSSQRQQRDEYLAELRGDFVPSSPSSSIFSPSSPSSSLKVSCFLASLGHDPRSQEQEQRNWETWKRAAEERRTLWNMTGASRPSVRWQLVLPTEPFPPDSLPIGEEGDPTSGKLLYVCRAYYEGSYQLGKCGTHLGKTRHTFSFASSERFFAQSTFEILCSSSPSPSSPSLTSFSTAPIAWVPLSYLSMPTARPVPGGRDKDGSWLGVGRVTFKGGRHPAKIKAEQGLALFGWGGKEKTVKVEGREDVEVLVLV